MLSLISVGAKGPKGKQDVGLRKSHVGFNEKVGSNITD